MAMTVKTDKRTGIWLDRAELGGLKASLDRLGMSQCDVAERYGCRPSFVCHVLAGRQPCPDRLLKLMRRCIARAERAASRA